MAGSGFTFRETFTEIREAFGDRASWESGLTDRLMKRLMFLASEKVPDWDQDIFEATAIEYGRRKLHFDLGI